MCPPKRFLGNTYFGPNLGVSQPEKGGEDFGGAFFPEDKKGVVGEIGNGFKDPRKRGVPSRGSSSSEKGASS